MSDAGAGPAHAARLAVLAALDADAELREAYALKGGLVMRHVHDSPRLSDDLDLNHVEPRSNELIAGHRDELRSMVRRLRSGLRGAAAQFGLDRAGVRIERWSAALPTVFCEVWYRTPAGEAGTVPLQVTLSEVTCRTVRARIDGIPVLVADLEDIVADKLKVLLQTVPRHQIRPSDVFDLWFALESAPVVPDPVVVGQCLRRKASQWPELRDLSPASFRVEPVRSFAEAGYRRLRVEQPDLPMPPFDEVWARVLALVDSLALPREKAARKEAPTGS